MISYKIQQLITIIIKKKIGFLLKNNYIFVLDLIQKIEKSVELVAAAKQQLQLLAAVDRNRWLYQAPALQKAIHR